MSIHLTFNHVRQSDSVSDRVNEVMSELVKITDDKFPFHINLTRDNNEDHEVVINCHYHNKDLVSKATHENLYKAINKSAHSMKTQVLRKADKLRND